MAVDLRELRFKPMNKEQLGILIGWAAEEGWNPGLHDLEAFWNTDPRGYLGCFRGEELIAGGSIVSYNGQLGFMGLFIVKPAYRGQGVGEKLWHLRKQNLLKRLHKGAAIGMDGVVAMQPFYERGGFQIAFRDERYERMGEAFDIHPAIKIPFTEDFASVCLYDQSCFGAGRTGFLREWLTLPGHQPFVYSLKGIIRGYAVLRKAQSGYKIGPLFANSPHVAEALYKVCLNSAQGEPTYLDIPVSNPHAVALVEKYQANYVFECARMYHGNPPDIATDCVYGVTSFELG